MRTSRETAVFVYRGDRLLLLRRAGKGYWHVVAGVVEESESERDAAVRELLEETGLAVTGVMDLNLRQTHPVPYDLRDRYPTELTAVTVANFVVEAPHDWDPIINEEHDDYRWCSFDDAFGSLHWDLARDALRELARRRARARR